MFYSAVTRFSTQIDVLFPYGKYLFGRPDPRVKDNATDRCQMLAVLIERRKQPIFLVVVILI